MVALQQSETPYVAFDLPGHGFSEGDGGLIFEVADSIHAVAGELGPVRGLVAHSFASGAAALAVSEGLPISRLVLIAPPLWPAGAGRFHRVAARMGFPVEVADEAVKRYRATTTPERAGYDFLSKLAELNSSVLIVSGADDERMAVDDARTVAPTLPRGELFEVGGTDHRGSAQDARVVARVVAFLTREPPSS
jgi:pimeloyl-ACP methyl ester carboxylesterase